MAKKQFDNTNKVSIWKRTSKGGKEYMNGIVNVDGTDYKITLFTNDYKDRQSQPDFRGTIEEKEE